MKHFLSLFVVIGIASVVHDIQRTWLVNSLSHTGDVADGRTMITGASAAASKQPSQKRSKMVFQILVDIKDPKKKKRRKKQHKVTKSLRATKRKVFTNHEKNRRHKNNNWHGHKNHYHALKNLYKRKLKATLRHGNHYHKLNQGRLKKLVEKVFSERKGRRKGMRSNKRHHGRRKSSRRKSKKYRSYSRSKSGKQRQKLRHRKKKPVRHSNRRRQPTRPWRNQWRRGTKQRRPKYSNGKAKKNRETVGEKTVRRGGKDFNSIEFILYSDTKKSRS